MNEWERRPDGGYKRSREEVARMAGFPLPRSLCLRMQLLLAHKATCGLRRLGQAWTRDTGNQRYRTRHSTAVQDSVFPRFLLPLCKLSHMRHLSPFRLISLWNSIDFSDFPPSSVACHRDFKNYVINMP